jgi:hypothetical protein
MVDMSVCHRILSPVVQCPLGALNRSYCHYVEALEAGHVGRHLGGIQQDPVDLRKLQREVLSQLGDVAFRGCVYIKERNGNLASIITNLPAMDPTLRMAQCFPPLVFSLKIIAYL